MPAPGCQWRRQHCVAPPVAKPRARPLRYQDRQHVGRRHRRRVGRVPSREHPCPASLGRPHSHRHRPQHHRCHWASSRMLPSHQSKVRSHRMTASHRGHFRRPLLETALVRFLLHGATGRGAAAHSAACSLPCLSSNASCAETRLTAALSGVTAVAANAIAEPRLAAAQDAVSTPRGGSIRGPPGSRLSRLGKPPPR